MSSVNNPMEACPKYFNCSAAICPLDPEFEKRVSQRGDTTCIYLIEASKINSETVFDVSDRGDLRSGIVRVLQHVNARSDTSKFGHLKRVLEKARRSGVRKPLPNLNKQTQFIAGYQ